MLAHYGVSKPKVPSPRGKLSAFQLRSVVDFVDAHLSEDVSLTALARPAHVSPFHFARLFRRTIGVPPHQFVLQLRLQRALGLMKTRTLSLARIAVECGFHDQPHFTRTFRKVLARLRARIPSPPAPIEQVSTRARRPGALPYTELVEAYARRRRQRCPWTCRLSRIAPRSST